MDRFSTVGDSPLHYRIPFTGKGVKKMEKNPFEAEFNKKAVFNLNRVTPAPVTAIAADKTAPMSRV